MGLGVKQEHDDELEGDPATVDGHVLPTDSVQGIRVDVIGEEEPAFSKHLLDTDTAVSLSIRPEFKQIGCGWVGRLGKGLYTVGTRKL